MRRVFLLCGLVLPVALGSVLFSGCAAVGGFFIGSRVDRGKPDYRVLPASHLMTLPPNQIVRVILSSGDSLRGRFRGVATRADAEYLHRYERWRASRPHPERWPIPGDSLTLVLVNGRQVRIPFLGISRQALWFRADSAVARWVLWSRLAQVRLANGEVLSASEIAALTVQDCPPAPVVLLLELEEAEARALPREVPLEQVDQVQTRVRKRGWLVGLAVGTAVDVAVVLIVREAMEDFTLVDLGSLEFGR